MHLRAITILSLLIATAGCRFLNGTAATTASVAAAARASGKPARRTIQLELLFIRHDAHDAALGKEFWTFVDEQFLAPDIRDRLAANGLRVGVVGDHLPPHLAARLRADAATSATGGELATDAAIARRILQLLPGRHGEIVTSAGIGELVLLERVDRGVSGATYRDASTLFSLEATPAANGAVQITVVPEVKHGPLAKSWAGEDGMLRLETGQRRHRLEHLSFTATLPRDAVLVVGCAGDDSASVGDCLLRDRERGSGTTMRLLAIRPLADTIDPLFTHGDGQATLSDDVPLTIH